jgi:hemerythrin superfamily protein
MATRTQSRSSSRSADSGNRSRSRSTERSAFGWGEGTAPVIGAAIAGVAIGMLANYGRKLVVQSFIATDDWAESLTAEHEMVLATFDKMLATDSSQTMQRTMLLGKLAHMLDRHAYSEEHVIYPALREANDKSDAEMLETEHGEVKEYLFRLKGMEPNDSAWLEIVREFRASVAAHAKMEEEEIFPRLKNEIDDQLDSKLTTELAKASFLMA